MPRVSLVLTVKNEAPNISRLLESIAQQTRRPDQIVVVDGGSTDDTLTALQKYSTALPLEIISQPGANISTGRNAAIRRAENEIIAVTDAGVRLDARWLEEICKPFEAKDAPAVVSGFFVPDPQTNFELALAATTLPALQDIRPEKFLPSSRSVAFQKRVWEQIARYPEWLDYCEDLIFDLRLRAAGCRFAFAPHAYVYFRPRPSLAAFFKQYYLYARGDGKANLWFKRHLIRYLAYLVALPLTLVFFFSGARLISLALWVIGFLAMFFTPYQRLLALARANPLDDERASHPHLAKERAGVRFLRAALWIPLIRVTGDVAKMLGYPVGVAWRLQNNSSQRRGDENIRADVMEHS